MYASETTFTPAAASVGCPRPTHAASEVSTATASAESKAIPPDLAAKPMTTKFTYTPDAPPVQAQTTRKPAPAVTTPTTTTATTTTSLMQQPTVTLTFDQLQALFDQNLYASVTLGQQYFPQLPYLPMPMIPSSMMMNLSPMGVYGSLGAGFLPTTATTIPNLAMSTSSPASKTQVLSPSTDAGMSEERKMLVTKIAQIDNTIERNAALTEINATAEEKGYAMKIRRRNKNCLYQQRHRQTKRGSRSLKDFSSPDNSSDSDELEHLSHEVAQLAPAIKSEEVCSVA